MSVHISQTLYTITKAKVAALFQKFKQSLQADPKAKTVRLAAAAKDVAKGDFGINNRGTPIKSSRAKHISMSHKANFEEKLEECDSPEAVLQNWIVSEIRSGCVSSLFLAEYTNDSASLSSSGYHDIKGIPLFRFETSSSYKQVQDYVNAITRFGERKKSGMLVTKLHSSNPNYVEGVEVKGRRVLMRLYDPTKDPRCSLIAHVENDSVEVGSKVVITWNCTDTKVLNTTEHDGKPVFHLKFGKKKLNPGSALHDIFKNTHYALKSVGRYNEKTTWHFYQKKKKENKRGPHGGPKARAKRARQSNEENESAAAATKKAAAATKKAVIDLSKVKSVAI